MNETMRFIGATLGLATAVLGKNPVRSLLTAFGILVGVFAVTVVVALGEGASRAVGDQMAALGTATLDVSPRARRRSGVKNADAPEALTEADALALVEQSTVVRRAAPIMDSMAQVVFRDENLSTQVKGTTLSFFSIRDWKPAHGALWSRRAEIEKSRVCVLGKVVKDGLFGPEDPVGRVIRIGRFPFTVVGVLEEKGGSLGNDMDDRVILPVGSFRARLRPALPGQVDRIVAQADAPGSVERARRQIEGILRQRHGIEEGAPNDFRVSTQRRFRQAQEQILGVLRLLLLGIATVSLIVGGIGVMNIMLVSVTERTREIGIRMAIGARRWHIQLQFLMEAVVLCLLGGLGGTLAALVGVVVLGDALDLPMRVSAPALGAALATSTAIGVIFGLLPARRAAALDPIEALRAEA